MADVNLISILPANNVQGASQVQGATPQAGSVQINLPAGTVLSGFIVNRDASGNPILRTNTGDITFSSNYFLKIGSEVVIRIENLSGQAQAHILSVDGQPPDVAMAQSSYTQEPEVLVGNAPNPASSSSVPIAGDATNVSASLSSGAPTITVSGTLIASPGNTQQTQVPVGSQLTLKITSLSTTANTAAPPSSNNNSSASQANPNFYATYARAAGPATTQTANTAQPSNPTAASVTNDTAAPADTPAAAVSIQFPADNSASATIVSNTITNEAVAPTTASPSAITIKVIAPASQATVSNAPTITEENTGVSIPASPVFEPLTAPLQPGHILPAIVSGTQPTGEVLVQTPIGTVQLQPGIALPTGSTVTFEVSTIASNPSANTPDANAATSNTSSPLTALARQWTTLSQIFQLLSARDNAAGIGFTPANMPVLPSHAEGVPPTAFSQQNMPAGLLLFMSALRGGDFQSWLGRNNAQWLEDSGHGDLLRRADGEFMAMGQQFTQPPTPQSWQTFFFPVMTGAELQQARFFVKRDRKKNTEGQQTGDEDTRFVIEMDMSQMGEIQMDGLVQKREENLRFDLVFRSHTPLPRDMQQELLQIYNDTGELTGYKGSMMFQSVKEFPVNPMEEVVAHAMKSVVA